MLILQLAFAISLFWNSVAFSAPEDPSKYIVDQGPFLDLSQGSILQGSVAMGGTQPDYIIDMNHLALQPLWNYARQLKPMRMSVWKKIEYLQTFLKRKVLPGFRYDQPEYKALIDKYRSEKHDIPIGEYAACGAGVCREYGILQHLAMKEAGIPNFYVYAKIQRRSLQRYSPGSYDIIEDHAFSVIEVDRKKWVVDAYFSGFNGYRLDDLMKKLGVTTFSEKAPIALEWEDHRAILELRKFVAWQPKFQCRKAYR